MSRDPWRDAIRVARGDPTELAALLDEPPDDGLQHAGNAVVTIASGTIPDAVAVRLIAALRERAWIGDDELAAAIERRHLGREPVELAPISVSLEDLAEVLGESAASESLIDLDSGVVWPSQLFDIGQGPDDVDPNDEQRWLPVVGLGPSIEKDNMMRYIATISDTQLALRLTDAIGQRDAFQRFRSTLERVPEQFTRWHRYRDDAWLGQARHWLAQRGYEPAS